MATAINKAEASKQRHSLQLYQSFSLLSGHHDNTNALKSQSKDQKYESYSGKFKASLKSYSSGICSEPK